MPAEVQAETVVDFCRRLDCDVIQLGDFSMPESMWVGDPYQVITPEVETAEHFEPDGTLVRLTHTPWGELTATFRSGHPCQVSRHQPAGSPNSKKYLAVHPVWRS